MAWSVLVLDMARYGEDALVPGEPGFKASTELDEMIGNLLRRAGQCSQGEIA